MVALHERAGGLSQPRAQGRRRRQLQDRARRLALLVGHVGADHRTPRHVREVLEVAHDRGPALGEHAQQRGRRFPRARIAEVRDGVRELDVRGQLREGDAAGDDRA